MRWQLFRSLVFIINFTLISQIAAVGLAQSNTSLSIMISSQSTGNHPKIKGYYVYVKDGQKIRKEIERVGGWAWSFPGEYIKEVKVQMVAGDGSYQLLLEKTVRLFSNLSELKHLIP